MCTHSPHTHLFVDNVHPSQAEKEDLSYAVLRQYESELTHQCLVDGLLLLVVAYL